MLVGTSAGGAQGFERVAQEWQPKPARRRTLIDLSPMVHCSVIGTCLSVPELRKVVRKILGDHVEKLSEHDLHTQGVRLASVPGLPSKLLHKALDEKHGLVLRRFAQAVNEDDVRAFWADARLHGQIEGAYWAAITHPLTSEALFAKIFGDVHMLSHLVGSTNRADIRRLLEAESEVAMLRCRLEEANAAMRAGFSRRDKEIAQLRNALAAATLAAPEATNDEELAALRGSLGNLQRQLDCATLRTRRLESAVLDERRERDAARTRADGLQHANEQLERDLTALESCVAPPASGEDAPLSLCNKTILYVGGKSGSVTSLRAIVERRGGAFVHHDGGQTQNIALLAGLIRSADAVFFPVDFVSHQAMQAVKRYCALGEIPFVALHRSGAASLARALDHVFAPEASARVEG